MKGTLPARRSRIRPFPAVIFSLLISGCASDHRHPAPTPQPSQTPAAPSAANTTAARDNAASREVEIRGIIESTSAEERSINLRLSAEQQKGDGAVGKVLVTASTRINAADRPEENIGFSNLEAGRAVFVAGEAREEVIEARVIVLQLACTLEFCPQKNCRHKCGAKPCRCPVL